MSESTAKAAHVWARDDLDWYVEPEAASAALFRVERFAGDVFDPACGQGNIVSSARGAGLSAYGGDVVDRTGGAPWFWSCRDFLAELPTPPVFLNIVCNPPFFRGKGTEAFIRRSLVLASHKVAIFCDIRFLAGAARATGLFSEHPPHRIWIVTPRVSCPPGIYLAAGNKAGNGSSDWCWLVWDKTAPFTCTSLHWLDCRKGAAA